MARVELPEGSMITAGINWFPQTWKFEENSVYVAVISLRSQKGHTAVYGSDALAPGLRAELVIDLPTYIGELLDARLGKVDDNFDTLCMVHNDLVDGSGEKIEYINGYVVIDASPN